jgi:hypothetical protein
MIVKWVDPETGIVSIPEFTEEGRVYWVYCPGCGVVSAYKADAGTEARCIRTEHQQVLHPYWNKPPKMERFPDQDAAWAAYRIGGDDAVRAIAATLTRKG